MSLEIITIGEVVRAPRERLTPGTLITGLIDCYQVVGLIPNIGSKLSAGEEKLAVKYRDSAQEKILIDNTGFRNTKAFWGRIVPESALILPADISLAPARARPQLNPDGLALLMRYGLISTGKKRIYLVECSFFRETNAPLVWVFARERENKNVMERAVGQRSPDYAQRLREDLDLMFAAP